jgi:hypothetical protein
MDVIAARAASFTGTVPDMDTDTDTTDVNVCAPPTGPTSTSEGTDMSKTALPPRRAQLFPGLPVMAGLLGGTVVTVVLLVAGAVPIGVVTGVITALVAVLAGLGKNTWLVNGRRNHPTRDGLLTRSQ